MCVSRALNLAKKYRFQIDVVNNYNDNKIYLWPKYLAKKMLVTFKERKMCLAREEFSLDFPRNTEYPLGFVVCFVFLFKSVHELPLHLFYLWLCG